MDKEHIKKQMKDTRKDILEAIAIASTHGSELDNVMVTQAIIYITDMIRGRPQRSAEEAMYMNNILQRINNAGQKEHKVNTEISEHMLGYINALKEFDDAVEEYIYTLIKGTRQHKVTWTYHEDIGKEKEKGEKLRSEGSVECRKGVPPSTLARSAYMIYSTIANQYPEEMREIEKTSPKVEHRFLEIPIGDKDIEGKTRAEVMDILRAKVEEQQSRKEDTRNKVKNDKLRCLWEEALDIFENMPNPDELDQAVYKQIAHLAGELTDDMNSTQIRDMSREFKRLLEILRKS